jgi:hypothetical protein
MFNTGLVNELQRPMRSFSGGMGVSPMFNILSPIFDIREAL